MFQAAKKLVGLSLAVALSLVTVLVPAAPAIAAPSSTYHYQFEGNTNPFVGNSTLTLLSACPSTNPNFTPCNSSTSFGTAGGDGYLAWTSNESRGGGFKVSTPSVIGDSYSVSLKFEFSDVSGYRKIIDYENYVSDNGFYLLNGGINFYPLGTSQNTYAANTILNLLVTRQAAPVSGQPNRGIFTVYVYSGSTLNQVLQVTDTNGSSKAATVGAGSLFGFFFDDDATSGEATPSGKVYDLKIWSNTALTAAQVNDVALAPATVTIPATPATPTATSGAVSATVSVPAPTSGGAPDSYLVTASPGGATCTIITPDTSCTITGLTAGTAYTFTATATNGAGTSSSSSSSNTVSPSAALPAAPGTPGTPTAVAGDGQATVTVVAPSSGGAVSSYTVTASPGGATCTVVSPATSCVVAPLTNNVAYTFSATATNASGTSAASAASAATTPLTAPVSVAASSTAVTITSMSSRSFSTVGGEKLTLFGSNLSPVQSVTVAGKVAVFESKSSGELIITIPDGTPGLASVVIRTASSIFTFVGAFTYVLPNTSAQPENAKVQLNKLIGFTAGSWQLTASMKLQLQKIAEQNKSMSELSCSGYSQGPTILRNDRLLAANRAVAACTYLRSLLPGLKIETSVGKNYTTLGAVYRRVDLSWR